MDVKDWQLERQQYDHGEGGSRHWLSPFLNQR